MSNGSAIEGTSSASAHRSAKIRKRRIAGLMVFAIVAGVGLVHFGTEWYKGLQAERAVTSYLEAVQNGDVEEAFSYRGSLSDSIRTDFLTADALNTAWDVHDVSVEERDTSFSDHDYFWVHVTIGITGVEVSDTFRVVNHVDLGWRVESAITYLAFDSMNYGYLEINGYTADTTVGPRSAPHVFALLPGIYDFYSKGDSLLEYDGGPILALGSENQGADGQGLREGTYQNDSDISDRLKLSDGAEDRYHQAIRDHIDECVEALTGDDHGGNLFACELGATDDQLQSDVGESYSDFRDYQWDVTSYPTAELEYEPYPHGEMIWLRGESKQSGAATLTVKASDANGSETQFEFACEVSIEHSRAVVDHAGELYFHPKRFTGSSVFRNVYERQWDEFFADTQPCSLA